jgi:hypothetical protein
VRPDELFLRVPRDVRGNYASPKLDPEDWKFRLDNEFATSFFEKHLAIDDPLSSTSIVPTRLCEKCRDSFCRGVSSPFFSIAYSTSSLSANAYAKCCDLCVLLWKVCMDNSSIGHSTVRFERRGSTLQMSNRRFPVLSLCRDHGMYRNPMSSLACRKSLTILTGMRNNTNDVQIGFSQLPLPGQGLHCDLIRAWLQHCDNEHWSEPKCRPSRFKKSAAGSIAKIPTRLIAVGDDHEDTVKLQEMQGLNSGDWVALSYQWGPPPHFSTTPQNIENHHAGIEIRMLPQTFQDAIRLTRALKLPYLWIDSICIIQGPQGDFDQEAKTMEDVYNGAYCVIAASCATGQDSGFLLPRKSRQFVTVYSEEGNHGDIHVCEMIDNFQQHVLQGNLSRRGWVLQEHALARRTLFFTEHQTYWECGHGIRCETMATLMK